MTNELPESISKAIDALVVRAWSRRFTQEERAMLENEILKAIRLPSEIVESAKNTARLDSCSDTDYNAFSHWNE